ncbi:hypothetical protein, conserved [Leishmania lindenbergi]|uniref:J domain-containing protein n=1 Tax=Leishmania lindenbergi TaxID=651832 RepID=A0AAW3AW56_9TRYP
MSKLINSHRRHRFEADALSPTSSAVALAPLSLPVLVVSATAAEALSILSLQTAPPSKQLAKLPVRVLTQLVQWRLPHDYCASVSASAAGDAGLYGGHSCMWAVRACRRGLEVRLRAGIRWAAAVTAFEAAAYPRLSTVPSMLLESVSSPYSSCVYAQSIIPSAAANSVDSSSTGAAAATLTGSLRIARRCYSSFTHAEDPNATTAAASATSKPEGAAAQVASDSAVGKTERSAADSSSNAHEKSTEEQKTKEDGEAAAVPPFPEIYSAFCTLQLVQDDGRVVREWTVAHVKQAYRTLAKQLHPDVTGGDDELMEQVNTSYDLIMSLSAEVADNYRMWLDMGGEAELQLQRAQEQQELLRSRWTLREVEQLMMLGWCGTLSGIAMYAVWRALYGTSSVPNSVGGTAPIRGTAVADRSKMYYGINAADVHSASTRLTLPQAGATVSTAAGVQYGVVSIGGSALWIPPHLSFQVLRRVRTAVSHYALAVALTLAAWMKTVMLQRVLQRMLDGGGGGAG